MLNDNAEPIFFVSIILQNEYFQRIQDNGNMASVTGSDSRTGNEESEAGHRIYRN